MVLISLVCFSVVSVLVSLVVSFCGVLGCVVVVDLYPLVLVLLVLLFQFVFALHFLFLGGL